MTQDPINAGPLHADIYACIQHALVEDIGSGDATTESIVPLDSHMTGQIISKQAGICAGLDVVRAVYQQVNDAVVFDTCVAEGAWVENRQMLAKVSGPARALLTAERTALNFLGRISGIATLTHAFVSAVAGTQAVILDTRKTAPGLRQLDKLAVRRGGGRNHRTGLYDMVLIKDNHIDFAGSIAVAVQLARSHAKDLEIEVETRTLEDVAEALGLGVQRILLDNMTYETMRKAVEMTAGRARLEASGNVTLANVRQVAETGVDFISIGALTHSVTVFDVSFLYID
jgi:nicotinate-nucleotide pyrophosphorylase (carboxylating)